jgi:hypothetical protein
VAKVKRALLEVDSARTDVTADRKAGVVYVGIVRVAKWDGEAEVMRLRGEGKLLEVRIAALIAGRYKEDELSE